MNHDAPTSNFPNEDSNSEEIGHEKTGRNRSMRSSLSSSSRILKIEEENHKQRFLDQLRKAFEDADPTNLGYITQAMWDCSSFKTLLRDGTLTDKQFKTLFKKIDAQSEGKITWSKLTHYLMKEIYALELNRFSEAVQFIRKLECPLQSREHQHRDIVTQIACSYRTNEYITVSVDSVRFWDSSDLVFKRMIVEPGCFKMVLVFDSVLVLAIATTNRRMMFYNLETHNKLHIELTASPSVGAIKGMSTEDSLSALKSLDNSKNLPMFNFITTLHVADKSIADPHVVPFFVGDDCGLIEVYHLYSPVGGGPDFIVERISKLNAHSKEITQISTATSSLYASSSMDGGVLLFSYNSIGKTFQSVQLFRDQEPIRSFYFNSTQNFLVTSSITRDAFIWSKASNKKIFKLDNHYSQISKVSRFATANGEDYILTMTTKKDFRLYDSQSYRLVKEWHDPTSLRPLNQYTALLYDEKMHCLITASSIPVRWIEDKSTITDPRNARTHNYRIVDCFYSSEFQQMITVDAMYTIKTWDVLTGRIQCSYMERPTRDFSEVVCASLDSHLRCLITSSHQNEVHIWNFNSGSLINTIDIMSDGPTPLVSCICAANIGGKDLLARAGWDMLINVFLEVESGKYEPFRTFKGHSSEISCLVSASTGFISGDVNGEIISWALDKHSPYGCAKLNTEAIVECMLSHKQVLFVGDSYGYIHIFRLPKLTFVESYPAHSISTSHSLTSFALDDELSFFYSSDTLGYVKKWKLSSDETTIIEPLEIYRCHNDEIAKIVLIHNGKFIATCGMDKCVRIFRTEDFSYIGVFYNGGSWNINDPSTYINERPFHKCGFHFEAGIKNARKPLANNTQKISVAKSKKITSTISVKDLSKIYEADKKLSRQPETYSLPNLIERQNLDGNNMPESLIPDRLVCDYNELFKFQHTLNEYVQEDARMRTIQALEKQGQERYAKHPPLTTPQLITSARPAELLASLSNLIKKSSVSETSKSLSKAKMPILMPSWKKYPSTPSNKKR